MSHATATSPEPDQLDSAWKCALECLYGDCLTSCFPAIAALLDLSRPFVVLDSELHRPADGTSPAASACHADRVLRCHGRDGREVCLHIEVQCQREENFAERMFLYHALLFAKYRLPVISLAILGDNSATWRPGEFSYQFGNSGLAMRFVSAKLLDLEPRLPAMMEDRNLFALFVAGHLEIMRTKGEPLARRLAKCRLTETLCRFGLAAAELERMLELLDRLMQLPPEHDALYRQFISHIKEEPMQTLAQRLKHDAVRRGLERGAALGLRSGFRTGREAGVELGREQGREQGREEGREEGRQVGHAEGRDEGKRSMLLELMERRFGPLQAMALNKVQAAGPDDIARWSKRFCEVDTLEELLG